MKQFMGHIRKYILRGLFAIIPIGLSLFAVRFFYVAVDQKVMGAVHHFTGFNIPGFGFLLLLVFLYFLGLGASNVLGKQLLGAVERITDRIPIVKTTYQVGKQVASAFSLPEKQVFKKAVLVDYLKPGIWTVGFVTGAIIDRKNKDDRLLKVFVPTPPNPTSGTMVVVRESQTRDPGWTIEEALRCVISGGIIGPEEIK